MKKINNEANLLDNEKINAIRAAIEHRATWMALMFLEMEEAGCDAEKITRAAIRKTGLIHGAKLKEKCEKPEDIRDFKQGFLMEDTLKIFEMDLKTLEEKELYVEFHYCALVQAWLKLGIDQEKISLLCDIAMEGDRGIAEAMGFEFELTDTIAEGCKTCNIRFLNNK
ncbi:L-2-amino-thiazoline-4-carboxylic acid hydrolase [Maledivibacter halophilus]|uniref:L-2-amino-thiazoline-4-carboxylic acid hydrolase n=1 Tax=Maledivibacter halophilus TaxID=36842 RepID=A0A1T5MAI2_9FIRM|nr:L-2-amino-thiazoline-4-carboxylic acid hydrolase [Maledivibacter halophilus]SKC84869.1 L-2-amino-thiazoline-4-carboxylic acid hydrolase [Maledivibacter halophilus]